MAGARKVKLGSQGLEVSVRGLGCMGMSYLYRKPKPEPDMIKLIQHAINAGITFLDTSDIYGPQTNEVLISKAWTGEGREKVQLGTKFGFKYESSNHMDVSGDPAYVKYACEASLKRLGVDYQPLLKSLSTKGAGGRRKDQICWIIRGVSINHQKSSCCALTAIQLEWSLWTRDAEEEIIPTCRELGIGIVTYSPLGRGFFSFGPTIVEKLEDGDLRKLLPRFQPENIEHNKIMYETVNKMAAKKGCTPSQQSLAWVHHQGNDVVPIPGTTKIENLEQNIGALSVKLTPEDMAELDAIASSDSVKGGRYWDCIPTFKDTETPPLSSWKS